MTKTVKIQPSGHHLTVEGNDSILEAALKAGLALDYGCSNGNCGLCKARLVQGEVRQTNHTDFVFSDADRTQGYFLLCSNTPVTDVVIEATEASGTEDIPRQQIAARVKRVAALNDEVMLLHLQTPRTDRLRFLAGQAVNLSLPQTPPAAYPVASCPCDDRNLQFHVPRTTDPFAEQVFNGIRPQTIVTVDGPVGEFVLDEEPQRPLLFLACDTGFAPIKSLIEHAMSLEVNAGMHLYWLASKSGGQYLHNLCRSWVDALDEFHYTPLVLERQDDSDEGSNGFDQLLKQLHADRLPLMDTVSYIAGPADFVGAARELTEYGVAVNRLHTSVTS